MSKVDISVYNGRDFVAGVPGQIVDQKFHQVNSFVNEHANTIDFGVAVFRGTIGNATCKPMTNTNDVPLGISVRNAERPASTDGNLTVNYASKDTVGVLSDGEIWVKAAEAVREGDQVLALTAGGAGNSSPGALGGSQGGVAGTDRVDIPNAVWMTTTASGAMGKVMIKGVGFRRTTT